MHGKQGLRDSVKGTGSVPLSSRLAISSPSPSAWAPKRGNLVSCPAWGCTVGGTPTNTCGRKEEGKEGGREEGKKEGRKGRRKDGG